MLNKIPVFALASARLAHADTPGFKAQDVEAFDFVRMAAGNAGDVAPRATRLGHVSAGPIAGRPSAALLTPPASDESPDGNTVSLEEQMVHAAETRGTFELAATLYAKNLALLRTVLGRDGR